MKNILTNFKEKKKIVKLSMAAMVGALAINGRALISDTAHAELNSKEVADSNSILSTEVNKSVEVEVSREDAGATKEAVPVSVASDTTEVSGVSTKTQHTEVDDLKLVQASSETLVESLDASGVAIQAAESKQSDTNKELRTLKDAQKLYALQAANMQDPYALLQSDVIRNLRLYGNISQITLLSDENDRRKFVADKGDAVSNVLCMIFPSPAGNLSTEYGGVGEFSFSREPITAEMMAKIFAILNDYRNGKIVTDKTEEAAKLKALDTRICELDQKLSTTVNRVLHDEYFEERAKLESEKNEIKDHIYFDPSLKDIGANKSFLKFYGLDNELERIRKPIEALEVEEKEQKQISEELSKKIKEIDQKLSTTVVVVLYGENLRQTKEIMQEKRKKAQEKVKELSMQKKYLISYETNLMKFISMLMDATCMDSKDWVKNARKKIQDDLEHERQEYHKGKANVQKAKRKLEDTKQTRELNDAEQKRLKNLEGSLKAIEDSFEKKSKQLSAQLNQLQEYPKYLIEKILMSYLIKTLNTKEEVEKFYRELVKCLARNKSQGIIDSDGLQSEIDNESVRLDHLREVVQVAKVSANTPYKSTTYQNGSTTVMQFDKQSNKVTFASKSNTFQDCADTTVRHIVNLLSYSEEAKWSLLLKGADIEDLQKKLDAVVEAIGKEGTVPFYDLQTRLQLFFLYQSKFERGADDCSQLARTLWEYAIFNMTEEHIGEYNKDKTEEEQMYAIIYRRNYELNPGYINMLKLMYNISLVLPATRENSVQLKLAKTSIDELDELMGEKDKQLTEVLKKVRTVMQNIFSLFCKDKFDVGTVTSGRYENDIFGTVKVTFRNEEFRIIQNEGHACVDHNPFAVFLPEKFYTPEYLKDDFIKLLLKVLDKRQQCLSNTFYKIFSGEPLSQDMNEDLYKKYKALQTLELLRGEENNRWRIKNKITYDVLGGAKLISVNGTKTSSEKGKQKKLLDVLYSRFLSKFEPETRKERRKRNYCLARPVGTEEMNGFSYIKINDDEAYLLINSDASDEEGNINVPSQIWVKDEKKQLKVVRLGSLYDTLNCKKLTFASGFKKLTIDSGAFENASMEEVEFKGDIKFLKIGQEAFHYCSKLTNFAIPEDSELSELEIEDCAFESCTKLQRFTIPKKVATLELWDSAFKGCSQFENLDIPKDIELSKLIVWENSSIDSSAYKKFIYPLLKLPKTLLIDSGLFIGESFVIPSQVENLKITGGSYTGIVYVPEKCLIERNYECDFKFVEYSTEEDIVLNPLREVRDSTTLLYKRLAGNKAKLFIKGVDLTDLIIPSTVVDENGASLEVAEVVTMFQNIIFCEKVIFQGDFNELTIGENIFRCNSRLKAVKFEGGVKKLKIGMEAFQECSELEVFDLSKVDELSELEIGYMAFRIGADKCKFEKSASLLKFLLPKKINTLKLEQNAFRRDLWCSRELSVREKKLIDEVNNQLVSSFLDISTSLEINASAFSGEEFKIPSQVQSLKITGGSFDGKILVPRSCSCEGEGVFEKYSTSFMEKLFFWWG